MIESILVATDQKTVMGLQNNSLKIEWKKEIQMSLCFNIKLPFFFFFDLVIVLK